LFRSALDRNPELAGAWRGLAPLFRHLVVGFVVALLVRDFVDVGEDRRGLTVGGDTAAAAGHVHPAEYGTFHVRYVYAPAAPDRVPVGPGHHA
jgi:hypothetical protein